MGKIGAYLRKNVCAQVVVIDDVEWSMGPTSEQMYLTHSYT